MLNVGETMGTRRLGRLRKLYRTEPAAKRFFDWAAARKNDAARTSVERIARKADLDRRDAVQFARELEDLGCGQFIVGRRGGRSRMVWHFSLKSIGETASGKSEKLELVDADLKEEIAEDALAPMITGDTLSVSLSRDLRAALFEAASSRETTDLASFAQEILESWAKTRLEERRGTSIDRAVAYLQKHGEWADDPTRFFPAAKE